MTNVLGPVATALLTAIVALHGAGAVAAYGIGARIEGLLLIAPIALSSGLSPFIGQNWGAHLDKRVAKGFSIAVRFSALWGLAAFVLLLPTAPFLAAIFSDDLEVQRDIVWYLRVVPLGYAGYGIMTMVSSAFNAMDHAVRSTVLSALRSLLIAVPTAYIGSLYFGIVGVFAGLTIGSIVAAAVGLRWMRMFLQVERPVRADDLERLYDTDDAFLLENSNEALRAPMQQLLTEMHGFDDVVLHRTRRDAVGFFVGDRELGHIHPSGHLDLPLPEELGERLVDAGLLEHHRMHDASGWYTHPLHDRRDGDEARLLLLLSHRLYRDVCAEGDLDLSYDDLEHSPEVREAIAIAVCRAHEDRRGSPALELSVD